LVGLDRFVARKKAAEILEAAGAIDKIEPYENNVGFSQRADVPIEPRLSEQWFLKYPAVAQSQACVADGRMKFHPDRWAKVYDHWLANIQDWCISRQLWWGHRIPVWNRANPGPYESRKNSYENLDGNYTVETICQIDKPDGEGWVQDPDVLDTWFSSWLWPFATMGWPERTDTLKKFYPTSDLVTGPDIIFFWVARMIMAGYEYMGDLPFLNVYFTGIVRDKNGDKMSKSLGNSPDPIPLMERYGADAIRFGILRSTPLGADAVFEDREFDRHPKDKRYDFAKIEWKTDRFPQLELARNLCNKLWNACRFRQMQGGVVQGEINSSLLTNDDKWILLKLDQAIKEITTALNDYKFNEAAQALYRFFWSEYCDWYVEASKAVFFGKNEAQKANTLAVIDFVLSHTLRLFHPFLPFITEELWHGMGYATDMPEGQGGKTIMNAPWPKPFEGEIRDHYSLDECYLQFAQDKYDLVTEGRNLRRIGNIQAAKKVKFVLKPAGEVIPHDVEVIKILLNAEALEIVPDYQPKKGTPTAHTKMGELFLPLEGLVDVAAEKARLTKEKEKIEAEIVKVEQKLSNPAFTQKVPANVLQEHQQRLVDWQNKLAHVKAALEALG
jgi:valyl-tRNA synthetase